MPADCRHPQGNAAMTIRHRLHRLVLPAAALCALAAAGTAAAGDYIYRYSFEPRPVTGSTTVNGYPMPFPNGASVNGAHAPSSGTYGGPFYFPTQTLQAPINGLGMVTLTVQWVHLGTSSAQYLDNTSATVTVNQMYLELQTAVVSGVPVPLSNCMFGPITWNTSGSWNVSYSHSTQTGFTIPPVGPTDCSGYGSTISNSVAADASDMSALSAAWIAPEESPLEKSLSRTGCSVSGKSTTASAVSPSNAGGCGKGGIASR